MQCCVNHFHNDIQITLKYDYNYYFNYLEIKVSKNVQNTHDVQKMSKR